MQTGNVRVTLARALEPWVTATAANPAWHRALSMQDGLVHSQVTQKAACPCNSFTEKAGVGIPPPPRKDPSPTPNTWIMHTGWAAQGQDSAFHTELNHSWPDFIQPPFSKHPFLLR